jgi:outer membrane lipopolysaccharide assembly protein LptE/RlpB
MVVLALSGCGYHIAGKGGRMPGGVVSLAIPIFVNGTSKPGIEGPMTSAFVRELLTTVEVREGGEAALDGVIRSYTLTPVSFTKSDVAQEYRLTVVVSLKVTRRGDPAPLWEDGNISDYEDFTVDPSDVMATNDAEEEAFAKISRDTARLVKERMLEGF